MVARPSNFSVDHAQEFYGPIAQAQPHAGHHAIAKLEEQKFRGKLTVVTMNVDGFHTR
jgi:NAD-dependent SIR2 family protein deacetylase